MIKFIFLNFWEGKLKWNWIAPSVDYMIQYFFFTIFEKKNWNESKLSPVSFAWSNFFFPQISRRKIIMKFNCPLCVNCMIQYFFKQFFRRKIKIKWKWTVPSVHCIIMCISSECHQPSLPQWEPRGHSLWQPQRSGPDPQGWCFRNSSIIPAT